MFRHRTTVVVASITAILLLATSIVIASMFTGEGMLTSSTLAIITGLFGPTILQLVNLLRNEKEHDEQMTKVDRIEDHAERIDRTVNRHTIEPHKRVPPRD